MATDSVLGLFSDLFQYLSPQNQTQNQEALKFA